MAKHAPLTEPAGHARFLRCMRDAHAAYRAPLRRAARELGLDSLHVTVLDAIDADLAKLGARPTATTATEHNAADPSADLGVLYVFEGSALGAAVLHRQLLEHHGEHAQEAPLHYFSVLRAHAASRWPRVVQALEQPRLDEERVIRAARQVFTHILQTISEQGHAHARNA